jgi:hypothetical protein
MERALGIINCSATVITTSRYKLTPGQRVRLTDYYRSEQDARHDLVLSKFVGRNLVRIEMLDWADANDINLVEEMLEARDREDRAKQAAEVVRRRADRRAKQAVARAEAYARFQERQAERAAAAQETEKSEVIALFEQGRKDRLERDRRRQQHQELLKQKRSGDAPPAVVHSAPPAPVAPPPERVVPPAAREPDIIPPSREDNFVIRETDGDYSAVSGRATPPPDSFVTPENLADLYGGERASDDEVLPPSDVPGDEPPAAPEAAEATTMYVDPDALKKLQEMAEDHSATEPPPEPAALVVDDLDDAVLRFVLNEFSVKGRQKLKTHKALVRAVEQLELASEDLRKLTEDFGRKE